MGWQVVRADARSLPLADGSVDLIVTSPPYWGLRSYRDGGEHYDGQVGSEATPQQFVDELVGMIDGEWRRVLKPVGSLWLNLGDKYAGSGGSGTTTQLAQPQATKDSPLSYPKGLESARPKSLLGLPWRVALALIDRGWILRAEVIWSKPNGLPESVTDRVRRSHEQWFHFTLEGSYYSAVDEIREPMAGSVTVRDKNGEGYQADYAGGERFSPGAREWGNPLGRLPGSVRTVPTQPLIIPDAVKEHLGLVDHFAAFPMEWPRWIIQGWSPREVCAACGEGRRPVTHQAEPKRRDFANGQHRRRSPNISGGEKSSNLGIPASEREARIVGYACACPDTAAAVTPGVILDPFGGTGTTAGVAHALGRHGISVDLSEDYCRLARWRIGESGHFNRISSAKQEAML